MQKNDPEENETLLLKKELSSPTSPTFDQQLLLPLPFHVKAAYSIGHIMNDLSAACWFSFMLIYLTHCLGISSFMAGLLMLAGQVADACCTPTVGFLSDRSNSSLGRRRIWILIGYFCVAISFPVLLSSHCLVCYIFPESFSDHSDVLRFVDLFLFIIIFQFGWAATQVSHMALVPEITQVESQQKKLTSYRNTATVLSNIAMFLLAWLLLQVGGDGASGDTIDESDRGAFFKLGLTAIGIGIPCSLITFFVVREVSVVRPDGHVAISMTDWMHNSVFYGVCFLYMLSRLLINLMQTYLPFYGTTSVKLSKTSVAILPLLLYLGQLSGTLVVYRCNTKIGHSWTFILSGAIVGMSAAGLFFAPVNIGWIVYLATFVQGFGQTGLLVTVMCMAYDMIGENVETAAFVFGAYSLSDKLSCGIAIMAVQILSSNYSDSSPFFRDIVGAVPFFVILLAIVILAALRGTDLREAGSKRRKILSSPNLATVVGVLSTSEFPDDDVKVSKSIYPPVVIVNQD